MTGTQSIDLPLVRGWVTAAKPALEALQHDAERLSNQWNQVVAATSMATPAPVLPAVVADLATRRGIAAFAESIHATLVDGGSLDDINLQQWPLGEPGGFETFASDPASRPILLTDPGGPADVSDERAELNDAMDGWGTDVDAIFGTLSGLSASEQMALRNDPELMDRLNRELGRGDRARMMQLLDVDVATRADNAMDGWGTDESALREALRSATPEERAAIRADEELMARMDRELGSGDDREIAQILDPDAVTLHFDGASVVARTPDGVEVERWDAVSGNLRRPSPGAPDQTAPQLQEEKGKGPLPEGRWNLDPEIQQRREEDPEFWERRPSRAWGDSRTQILPKEWTEAYGRDQFFAHGGDDPGSAGCVDFLDQNDDFQDWLRDHGEPVELVVDYPEFGNDYTNGRD